MARAADPPAGWGGPSGVELRGKTLGVVGDSGHSGASTALASGVDSLFFCIFWARAHLPTCARTRQPPKMSGNAPAATVQLE